MDHGTVKLTENFFLVPSSEHKLQAAAEKDEDEREKNEENVVKKHAIAVVKSLRIGENQVSSYVVVISFDFV